MYGKLAKTNKIILGDILIDRAIAAPDIQAILSRLLGLTEKEIRIVPDVLTTTSIDSEIKLICELSKAKGQFVQLLSLFPRDFKLAEFDGMTLMKQFCQELACQVIVPADNLDPSSCFLINEKGEIFDVHLNLEREDEYNLL